MEQTEDYNIAIPLVPAVRNLLDPVRKSAGSYAQHILTALDLSLRCNDLPPINPTECSAFDTARNFTRKTGEVESLEAAQLSFTGKTAHNIQSLGEVLGGSAWHHTQYWLSLVLINYVQVMKRAEVQLIKSSAARPSFDQTEQMEAGTKPGPTLH